MGSLGKASYTEHDFMTSAKAAAHFLTLYNAQGKGFEHIAHTESNVHGPLY